MCVGEQCLKIHDLKNYTYVSALILWNNLNETDRILVLGNVKGAFLLKIIKKLWVGFSFSRYIDIFIGSRMAWDGMG